MNTLDTTREQLLAVNEFFDAKRRSPTASSTWKRMSTRTASRTIPSD